MCDSSQVSLLGVLFHISIFLSLCDVLWNSCFLYPQCSNSCRPSVYRPKLRPRNRERGMWEGVWVRQKHINGSKTEWKERERASRGVSIPCNQKQRWRELRSSWHLQPDSTFLSSLIFMHFLLFLLSQSVCLSFYFFHFESFNSGESLGNRWNVFCLVLYLTLILYFYVTLSTWQLDI